MTHSIAHWQTQASVKDRRGPPVARPAHLGHRPLQLPLPVLHAARSTYPRAPRFLSARTSACTSRKSSGSRACSCSSACASCASPAASRCCGATSPTWSRDLAAIPGVEDIALTTNGVLLARPRRGAKAAGLKRITVSLDSARSEHVFARMTGGSRRRRGRCSPASKRARTRGLRAAQDQRRRPARRQRSHGCSIWSSTSAAPAHIVRFIEYMDVGNCNDWQPEQVVPSQELRRRGSPRAGRCSRSSANYRGEVARALRVRRRQRRGRLHLLGDRSRSAATARARAVRRTARSTPACSRRRARTCATPLRAARAMRSCSGSIRNVWLRATIATANCAPRLRDARAQDASRCTRSAADDGAQTLTHLDARKRPRMVDVGAKAVTQREATAEARVRFPPRRCASSCARSGMRTTKGPVFDTAIIAGTMAAKRTHELIPFCHPLAHRRLHDRDRARTRRRGRRSAARSRSRTRPASRWKRSPAPASPRSRSTTCARRCRTRS